MAKETRKFPNRVTMSTPRGVLKWPKLTEIDNGTAKYPNPGGEYNTRQLFDGSAPNVIAFMAKLDAMLEKSRIAAEAAFAELPVKARKTLEAKGGITADTPYAIVYDEDTEQPTGQIEFRTKMKASGERKDKTKWSQAPALFDGKALPLKKGVEIWGGSTAVISFDADLYFIESTGNYGVTRTLKGAQIIDLVSKGGQRTASSLGFEAQEDGFDGSTVETSEDDDDGDKSANKSDTSGDDDETDF